MKDNRVKHKISLKIVVLLVILTFVLTASATTVGLLDYRESVYQYYDQTAEDIAAATKRLFTDDEILMYVDAIHLYMNGEMTDEDRDLLITSENYRRLHRQIENVRISISANDIYFCVVDTDLMAAYTEELKESGLWQPFTYIFDSYRMEEEELKFGEKTSVTREYRKDIYELMTDGVMPERYIITDNKWGNNMTGFIAVAVDGDILGLIGVEIPMETLRDDMRDMGFKLIGSGIIVLAIALVIGIWLSMKMLVRPVRLVAHEANHFISNEATVSDKLSTIKTRDEIQMLAESLLTMELSIKDYINNIQQITAEKERIGAELDVATRIQASMVPTDFGIYKGIGEFDIFALMTPAKEVGGDFYDFFMTDRDHLVLVMADVSGKGVPAALFMAKAKTAIKARAITGGTPSEILTDVNDMMCEGNDAELFVTVWMAIVDLRTGEGLAANAGHEHPALRHAGGEFELVKYRHGPAVATMEGIAFKEHEFKLEPGDTVFVYTDGVTEATDVHDELFGEERTVRALNRDPGAAPETLLQHVKEDIDAFVGEAPQFDDITMMAVVYHGGV